jgi:hypothetical protein
LRKLQGEYRVAVTGKFCYFFCGDHCLAYSSWFIDHSQPVFAMNYEP